MKEFCPLIVAFGLLVNAAINTLEISLLQSKVRALQQEVHHLKEQQPPQ